MSVRNYYDSDFPLGLTHTSIAGLCCGLLATQMESEDATQNRHLAVPLNLHVQA